MKWSRFYCIVNIWVSFRKECVENMLVPRLNAMKLVLLRCIFSGGNVVIIINDNGWWILSWWQHWPHWRMSLWQPLVLPVTKFTSKQYSRQWQYRSLLWRFRRWRQNWRHNHRGFHCTNSLSGWIRVRLWDKTQGLATFDGTHSLAIFLYPFHQGAAWLLYI